MVSLVRHTNRSKDGTDFEKFFKTYYPKAHHFAQQMVSDTDVCHDIVVDAFETILPQYQDIEEKQGINLLFRIVHNKCVDHVRRQTAHSRYVDFCMHVYSESNDESYAQREEHIDALTQMIEHLTPQTRRILDEHYFKKKKYGEVASEMGISIHAVKKHIVKALRFFRENMTGENEDE